MSAFTRCKPGTVVSYSAPEVSEMRVEYGIVLSCRSDYAIVAGPVSGYRNKSYRWLDVVPYNGIIESTTVEAMYSKVA